MKFELTLYVVLVFLVPGLIAASTIAIWSSPVHALILRNLATPDAGGAVALLVLAFAVGSLIDALRSLFVQRLLDVGATVKLQSNYLQKLNKDNLEVFRFLLERTQVYYRLNANTAVAATAFTISYAIRYSFNPILLLLVGFTTLFWLSARKSRRETIVITNQFAAEEEKEKKEEEESDVSRLTLYWCTRRTYRVAHKARLAARARYSRSCRGGVSPSP
jgi:ABC-type multidrug transport system fused ATPase/permease subunit